MIVSPDHPENLGEPALGYAFMSLTLGSVGLAGAAIAYGERFLELQTSNVEYHQRTAHETCAFCLTTLADVRRAIDHLSQSLEEEGDRFVSLAWRSALFCRTGQYRLAEQDLEAMRKTAPINHSVFCYHYWRGEREEAIEYFDRLAARPNFAVWLKCWGNLMLADPQLGDTEHSSERLGKGLDYLEEGYEMHNMVLSWIRFTAAFWCPPAVIRQLEESERYQSFLKKVGLDDSVRDQVMQMVNEISDVTGIVVTLDEKS
jgi:tetratricopeptide (TPR) repeat protein